MAIGRTAPLLLAFGLVAQASASAPVWDDQVRVALPGSVHPRLARLVPTRSVDPNLPLERMLLVLKMPEPAKAELDQLLKDQQNPASPRYHQWLTPEAFGQRFGPSQAQVDAATLWLLQQGFTVHNTAKSGLALTFSGTAAQVGLAFRTAIMEYQVDGVVHHGNATAASIPKGLAGFVSGVASLHDFHRTSYHRNFGRLPQPLATDNQGSHYIGPGDLATIYNLAPLFSAGTTGQGVTIAVVGRCDFLMSDYSAFLNDFGFTKPGSNLVVTQNGPDPGILDLNEEFEADIDTQWATAAAPGATIHAVISPSSLTTDGTDLSSQYIVDNNLAAVMTSSFGVCEAQMSAAENTFISQLWAQAAGQGISVFVASGDNGAAGCDDPSDFAATQGSAVSGLSSTPYNVSVGGTMFNEGSGTYWNSTYNLGTTATGYIPEAVWNESGSVANGDRLWAGGGGVSTLYAKPSWQAALQAGGMRTLPDVALSAAGVHDPYLVSVQGQLYLGGGTSIATPCMAGIMALVVQQWGRQGNPNPTLYSLGHAQYTASGPAVFHDVVTGSNQVPGNDVGFSAGTGYDLATGLGSLNAQMLVNNWVTGANPITTTIAAPASAVVVASGGTVAFSGSGSETPAGASLSYSWAFGDGAVADTASASHVYRISGSANQTFEATLTVSDGLWTESKSVPVTVTPAGVSATITSPVLPVLGFPGVTLTFSGTATTQNAQNTITYSWDFGDQSAPAQGATVTHAFASNTNGPYTVTLTATDGAQATGTATTTVFAYTPWGLDLNFDNTVDVRDLLVLAGAWGTSAQNAGNLTGFYPWGGDINGDGAINDTDLNLWLTAFNAYIKGVQ